MRKVIVHNHTRYTIEFVSNEGGVFKSIAIGSGQEREVCSYISAQVTQPPNENHHKSIRLTKQRGRINIKSIVQVIRKGDLLTEYQFHLFETNFK